MPERAKFPTKKPPEERKTSAEQLAKNAAYLKEKYAQVKFSWKKSEDEEFRAYLNEHDIKAATFIRAAIKEKMERDSASKKR